MPINRFGEVTVEQIIQAVDEACSNVIEHSYGNMMGHELSMSMNADGEKVVFVIEDTGIGLEGIKAQKPDIKEYVEQRRDGGWGRYIITRVMDEVKYSKRGKKNKLMLVKYYSGKRKEEGV